MLVLRSHDASVQVSEGGEEYSVAYIIGVNALRPLGAGPPGLYMMGP